MDSTIVPHDTFCNVIEEAVSAVEGRQTQPRPAAPVPSPPSHTSGPRASRGLVKQIVDNAFKQGGTVFLDPYGGRGEPALQAVACHPKITKATSIEVVDARHAEAEALKTEVVERLRQAGYDAAAQRVQDRVVNVLGDCREQDAGFDAATIIFLNNRHAKTCRGLPRFASAMSLEQDVAEIIVSANSKPHMRPQRRLIYALDPIPVLTDLGCDEQPPWMSDDAPLDTQHPALRIYRYTVPATPDPRQDAAAAPRRSSRQREPPRATRPPVPRPRPLVVVKLTPDWQTYVDNGCGRYVATVDGPLRGTPVKVTYALSDAPPEDVERTAVAPLLALGSDDHISLDRLVLEEYLAMATAIPKKDYRHEAVECLVKSLQEFHADWRAWLRSTRLDRVNDFQERVSYCCPSMELLKSLEKESRGLDVVEFAAGKGLLGRLLQALRGGAAGALVQLDGYAPVVEWTKGGQPLPSVTLSNISASDLGAAVTAAISRDALLLCAFPVPADDEAVAVFKAVARTTKARKVALVGMLNQKTCDEAMARALQARGYGKDGGDRPVPSWFAEGELRTSVGTGRGPSGVRQSYDIITGIDRPRERWG